MFYKYIFFLFYILLAVDWLFVSCQLEQVVNLRSKILVIEKIFFSILLTVEVVDVVTVKIIWIKSKPNEYTIVIGGKLITQWEFVFCFVVVGWNKFCSKSNIASFFHIVIQIKKKLENNHHFDHHLVSLAHFDIYLCLFSIIFYTKDEKQKPEYLNFCCCFDSTKTTTDQIINYLCVQILFFLFVCWFFY